MVPVTLDASFRSLPEVSDSLLVEDGEVSMGCISLFSSITSIARDGSLVATVEEATKTEPA